MTRGLAGLFLLLLAGCSSTPTSVACDVEATARRGRGVIVGPRTVLTVAHVVAGEERVYVDDLPAKVVSRHMRNTESGDDGIAVLELESGEFPRERIATVTDKVGAGVLYLPARGERPWPWGLEPGDSGSPILDASGRVTGLVRAVYGRAEPLDKPSADGILKGRDPS